MPLCFDKIPCRHFEVPILNDTRIEPGIFLPDFISRVDDNYMYAFVACSIYIYIFFFFLRITVENSASRVSPIPFFLLVDEIETNERTNDEESRNFAVLTGILPVAVDLPPVFHRFAYFPSRLVSARERSQLETKPRFIDRSFEYKETRH